MVCYIEVNVVIIICRSLLRTFHLDLGRRITDTCFMSYNRTSTGVGPESASAENLQPYRSQYLLRPEAMESIFYMWRLSHDPIYREMGWTMIQVRSIPFP
jgi:mannosyl-oligosaccharide alpha-1,2-mannosidase